MQIRQYQSWVHTYTVLSHLLSLPLSSYFHVTVAILLNLWCDVFLLMIVGDAIASIMYRVPHDLQALPTLLTPLLLQVSQSKSHRQS